MEVHHHTHALSGHRKKWTHYFWEFLMLFLAVFCGFLAENFREHYVEHKRSIQLAKNLYKETFADSIALEEKIKNRMIKEKACEYFISYVKNSSLTTLSRRFYPAFTWAFLQTAHILFEPNDGILNQLKNSGELRYFKSSEFQAGIGILSIAIANVRSRNEKEYFYVEQNLRPFVIAHYDFAWYESLTKNGSFSLIESLTNPALIPAPGQLINPDKISRLEAKNIASYYLLMLRGTRQSQYAPYEKANHQLLEILRKEYHLK